MQPEPKEDTYSSDYLMKLMMEPEKEPEEDPYSSDFLMKQARGHHSGIQSRGQDSGIQARGQKSGSKMDDNDIVVLPMPVKSKVGPEAEYAKHLQDNLSALKSFVEMGKSQRNADCIGFQRTHFSLALIAKFARENLMGEIKNGKNWSPEETFDFGEYVISILALTNKSHFTLNTMINGFQNKTLAQDIKSGQASQFLCHFYDQTKITNLVFSYFKSGYSKRKHTKM